MKICVINPNFYRSSGVTTAIKRLFIGLQNSQIDQYFIDCNYGILDETIDWIPRDRYLTFNLMSLNPFRLIYDLIRFIYWLNKNQIKVVHVYHRRLACILYLFEFLGIYKTIYTAQLSFSFSFVFWFFSPKILVAVSQSVKNNLFKTTRAREIYIIGNPCEYPSEYPDFFLDETIKNRAVCIARLDPVKGHEFLIDAWKIIIDKGYQYELNLIGEGMLSEKLQFKVNQLGLSQFVKFTYFRDDVSIEIKQCLFAILVSSVEGLPLVVIEAAALGRATLLNDVDGSRDCLISGQKLLNGLTFGQVPEMAKTLITWFQNPNDVVSDGRNMFYYCKENYSLESVANKYIDLYQSLA